jgi:hypothetical protein
VKENWLSVFLSLLFWGGNYVETLALLDGSQGRCNSLQYNINSEEATSQQPKKERDPIEPNISEENTCKNTHRYMVTQTYILRDPEDLAENSHLKKTRFSTKRRS